MNNISIIVPTFNSIATIENLCDTIFDQDYKEGKIAYIFIDGGSTDGTLEYLKKRTGDNSSIKILICNEGLSASRNLGVSEATYDLLAFTDSDCRVPRCWLSSMVATYIYWKRNNKRVVGVGGSNVPPVESGYFYAALETMKNSYIGSHGSVYGMSFQKEKYLSHIATVNALYEKSILLKYPFDEKMVRISEDADVTWRISHDGYCFVYNPRGSVWHMLRPTARLWIKNMFLYGQGRVMLFRKFPSMMIERPILLGPMILIISILFFCMGMYHSYLMLPFAGYVSVICTISAYLVLKKREVRLLPLVVFLFFISHVGYGLGQWQEFFFSTQQKRGKIKAH